MNRTKFDPRAFPGVFLGFSIHSKGYKVLDMATQKILISRDVIFHEKHFHYYMSKSVNVTVYPTEIFLPSITPIPHTEISTESSFIDTLIPESVSSSFHDTNTAASPNNSTFTEVSSFSDLSTHISPPAIRQSTR